MWHKRPVNNYTKNLFNFNKLGSVFGANGRLERLSCAKGAFRWSAALCGRKSLRLLVGFIYLLYNSFAGDGGSGNADPVVGKATVFPAPLFLLQAVGEP